MKKTILSSFLGLVLMLIAQFANAQCGSTSYQQTEICESHPITIHGQLVTTTGVYNDTISLGVGCDSFVVWQVVVDPTVHNDIYDTICQGDTVTFLSHKIFTTTDVYDTLYTGTLNCDSVIGFHVFVSNNPHPTDTVRATYCRSFGGPGQYYNFYGQHLTQAGTYQAHVPAALGCDTIRTLILSVANAPQTQPVQASICNGQSYTFHGQTYTTAGNYTYTVPSTTGGCDTVYNLFLQVTAFLTTNVTAGICAGQSYNFHGRILTTAGTYRDTVLSTGAGCDTIYRLTLTVGTYAQVTVRDSFCAGSTFTWHGHTYTAQSPGGGPNGGYKDTVPGVGCDTIYTLILRYKAAPTRFVQASICQGTYYHYGTDSFNTQGQHLAVVPNPAGGCDSTITIFLNFQTAPPVPTITGSGFVLTSSAAATYQWMLNGQDIPGASSQSYTATVNGTYMVRITTGAGCSSTSANYYVNNVGISDITGTDIFQLYPNPNKGRFTLQMQQYNGAEVMIYDILGHLVYQKQLTAEQENIDLSNAAGGTYYLTIRNGELTRSVRFALVR
jgi:hypothetical protein